MVPLKWVGTGKLIAEMRGLEFDLTRINRACEDSAGSTLQGEEVALRLRPPNILFRALKLPPSARIRLKQILAFELTRQSPLHPDDVLHSGRIMTLDRQHGQLNVLMAVLRRSVVEEAAVRLGERGLRLRSVVAVSPDYAPTDTILFQIKPNEAVRRSSSISALFLAAVAALILFNVSVLIWRDYKFREELSSKLTLLDQNASVIRNLRNEEISLLNLQNVPNRERAQLHFGRVAAEVTKLLPDSSYLSTLNFSGQQVQLEGYAKDPSSFIGLFDRSPLFSDAAFSGPITQDSTAQMEHFVITMNIVKSPP